MKAKLGGRTWAALLTFGLVGQIAWVIENMYFNVFLYNTISGDTSMIAAMVAWSAVTATVTLCHTGTRDVADHMRRADVIVAAMGSAGFVPPDKIKAGAVLVDVGVSRVYDEEAGRYRIKGDVDKACYDKASAYTPNPGGVGPMTRAMLLANVVEMAERHA